MLICGTVTDSVLSLIWHILSIYFLEQVFSGNPGTLTCSLSLITFDVAMFIF